jgi:hypothetical protein
LHLLLHPDHLPQSAPNVEVVVIYLDWLATIEGGFTIFHGFEGEHLKYDDAGVPCVMDAGYNRKDKDWTRHNPTFTAPPQRTKTRRPVSSGKSTL